MIQILLVLTLVLFGSSPAAAEPATSNLELETESTSAAPRPGADLTAENASSYERYLPKALRFAIEHGFRIKIVPPKRLEWSEGFKRATEKYSPQVTLDENDYLVNYVAGMPFPLIDITDPKAAVKIAHNWHMGPFMPDDFMLAPWSSNGYTFDAKNPKIVRPAGDDDYACEEFDFLRYAHRTEVDPRPTLGPNALGVEWKAKCTKWIANGLGTSINEGAGIWIRFLDPHHADEFFGFSEASRRVRRSAVNLEYPAEGCRACHQPFWAYALPKTENYSYRLLGTRTILACLTATEEPAGLKDSSEGMQMTEQPFELRHVYTIEMVPKDERFSSRRSIVDIDSEIYVWLASEFYEGPQRTAVAIPLWRRRPSPEGGSLFNLAGTFYVPAGKGEFFRSVVPAHGKFDQQINTGKISGQVFNPQNMH